MVSRVALHDETGVYDEEVEVDVIDGKVLTHSQRFFHPGQLHGDGYNPLGTTKFDELVEKTEEMYPGRVWVATLKDDILRRTVPSENIVTVRSTRYVVEVKVFYTRYNLSWDSGDLHRKVKKVANRSYGSNDFGDFIYDYQTILDEVSCGWKSGQWSGGYDRAQMSNLGLMKLAYQWNSPDVVKGVVELLQTRGTSIRNFVQYPSVKLAIGYAIMEGVMRAFGGKLADYVSKKDLNDAMRAT